MRIIMLLVLIFSMLPMFGQMPTDGDYSNWDWENQSQNNWKRKNGNVWMEINPPFLAGTERIGQIVDVHESVDYTKAKGWQLLWAQFDGIYPYFILYNPHKGLVRVFFYLDTEEFSHALVTLSYHDINSPGLLTYGNEYQNATDKYLDGSVSSDDMISVIIPFVGSENWCSADFPIFFDQNILNSKYNSKKWLFKFYGCYDYDIRLKGQAGPASTTQHTIAGSSSDVSTTDFSATHAKLHKQLQTTDKFMKDMQRTVLSIDSSSPQYLQGYKSIIESLKPVSDIFSTTVGISSGVGAVLGFMKVVNGTFDEQKSTIPTAVIEHIELEGSMKIKYNLGGNTLKIPGVNGSYYPHELNWSPYDCPTGYFNMSKTPTIKKTTGYNKYGCYDAGTSKDTYLLYNNGVSYMDNPLEIKTRHPRTGGYAGKIVKYKFDDNIELVYNNLPGLTLIDVHFAIVGRSQKDADGKLYYNVEEKVLAYHTFIDRNSYKYNVALENPIHHQLEEDLLIIHKFDKENKDVCFGTPYLSMNKLKGVVLEVPEHTDIKLRVVAKFSSDKFDSPIVFQANYNMNVQEVSPVNNEVYFFKEQATFPYSDYYLGEGSIKLSKTNNTAFTAGSVYMNPNFVGEPGFSAVAINVHPNLGNTVIRPINFNCSSMLKSAKTHMDDNYFTNDSKMKNQLSIYPNPSNGKFTVLSENESNGIVTIRVYNTMGVQVYSNVNISQPSINIELDNKNHGLYIIQTTLKDNNYYTSRVVIK